MIKLLRLDERGGVGRDVGWLIGYRRRCAAIIAIAAVAFGPFPAVAQRPVTAFVNVSVVPMDRERVLARQTVLVQGGRIAAMGSVGQVRVPDNAVRIDGRGKFLMPGLADMHMHLGIPGSGYAEQILFLLLANGVTTIRNLDYLYLPNFLFNSSAVIEAEKVLRLRERVAKGDLLGPQIYTSGEWHVDTSRSVAQNVEAYKAAGYDLLKVHDEHGPILDSLVEAARRVGMPIAGHPVGGLLYAMQHRFASVEHLIGFPGGETPSSTDLLADTTEISAVVEMARQAGVRVTPTLSLVELNAGMKVNPSYHTGARYLPPKLGKIYRAFYGLADTASAPVRDDTAVTKGAEVHRQLIVALQNGGVELLLGTDSPVLLPGYGVHQELATLVRAGLTPYQALLTGTRNVAAYFGTLDSAGTVAVGKRADLVLLSGDPLQDIRHTAQPAGVMLGGRWLPRAELDARLEALSRASTP